MTNEKNLFMEMIFCPLCKNKLINGTNNPNRKNCSCNFTCCFSSDGYFALDFKIDKIRVSLWMRTKESYITFFDENNNCIFEKRFNEQLTIEQGLYKINNLLNLKGFY